MKIVELKSENVKRLKAVQIRPDSNVVEITGKNEAGKSSVLDSILYAFSGKNIESKPIRNGEEKAEIRIDCGEFTVTRTITEKGKYLKIETKDGDQKKSPQAFLDQIVGRISFDPLDFMRKDPRDQKDILMRVVPDAHKLIQAKEEAAETTRQVRSLKREGNTMLEKYKAMPWHEDAPKEKPDASQILESMKEIQEKAMLHTNNMNIVEDLKRRMAQKEAEIETAQKEIKRLQELVELEKIEINQTKCSIAQMETNLEDAPDYAAEREDLDRKMKDIEKDREKWQENHEKEQAQAAIKDKMNAFNELKNQAKEREDKLAKLMDNISFPIKGLSFDDDGVLFNDIPLAQLSQAQKIRVGMAVSMAMNPKMKVIICKDASLLDDDNLDLVRELADKEDYQVWLERVDSSGKTGIFIEEGEVNAK